MLDVSDAELMVRVRSGDREAFSCVVERHEDGLVNYLSRLTGSRDRAEEVAQEAFLRLFRSASRYREQGRLAGYIYRIATNLVRQENRRQRRWTVLSSRYLSANGNGNGHHSMPEAQARLLREEVHNQLNHAVAGLPLRYRIPLVLRDIEGWDYRSIAHMTGCREGTVKSRISRGRQQLRHRMEPYWLRGDGHES